jgi:hypothetical protein
MLGDTILMRDRISQTTKSNKNKGEDMKIRDILTDRSKWTWGALARNEYEEPCDPQDEEAVQFSLAGAIFRAYVGVEMAAAYRTALALTGGSITKWNSSPYRTFEDVREVAELADDAAESARKRIQGYHSRPKKGE